MAGALVRAKVGCDGDLVAGVLAADPPAVRELLRRLFTAYCLQHVPGAALPPSRHAHAGAAPTAAPCALGPMKGADLGATEPGLAAARAPCTSDAEPQFPWLAGVGSALAAPAMAPGVEHAGAEMRALPWAPGLSAPAELGRSGSAGLTVPRKRNNKIELQGRQHSLPGCDSARDTPCAARDHDATPFEWRLAASTPQLSCGDPWHALGRGHAGTSLVPGARLAAKRPSDAGVLASLQGVDGSAAAASEPSSSIAAPSDMLLGGAGGSADAAYGLEASYSTVPEPPRMLAVASAAAAQPLHSHQDMFLQLAGGGSPAASRLGTWRADAGAAAPWPRCSLSASFQGSAGVPEPVACDSPRLRSPAATQGLGFNLNPWGRPSRACRALFSDSVASAKSDAEPGQAPLGDACSLGYCGNAPRDDVLDAASGHSPCTVGALLINSGALDSGSAAGLPTKAGLPCVQGPLEAYAPACPATAPCQRYACEEASLLSPEPAGPLPQAPMPSQRSPHAVDASPSDARGCGGSASTGALCAAAEAAHVHACGRDSSTAPAMVMLRRPLRPLCGTPAACQAAMVRGAHSGAMSCPDRGASRSAGTIRACAKVWPLHMFIVI